MVGRSRKQKALGNNCQFLSFFLFSFCLFFKVSYSLLCLFLYFSLCVIREDDDLTVELEEEGKLTYLINKLIN